MDIGFVQVTTKRYIQECSKADASPSEQGTLSQ
jgi:hypothetical protein